MENIIIDKKEYSIACKEVLEILKNIREEDLEKIPNKKIEQIKQNASNDYEFEYDVHKNIKEQKVSRIAKAILANLFIDYIASQEQKEKILNKQRYDLNKLEQKKLKTYYTNNIFIDNKANKVKQDSINLLVEVKKETFWRKIFNYIRKVFKV